MVPSSLWFEFDSLASPHLSKDKPDWDDYLLVGWREWIALPELGIDRIRAKLDSGATLSSLHAERIETFSKRRQTWVRFFVPSLSEPDPIRETDYQCSARLIGHRNIRSSNGDVSRRPVIETTLYLAGFQWPIELTLTDRTSLECPMLVGRNALSGRCLIDCGRSEIVSR
jgi:hypothetical protein